MLLKERSNEVIQTKSNVQPKISPRKNQKTKSPAIVKV